jgi:hypothetical protein
MKAGFQPSIRISPPKIEKPGLILNVVTLLLTFVGTQT